MLLVLYFDEFLFLQESKSKCEKNIRKEIAFLEDMGFIKNY